MFTVRARHLFYCLVFTLHCIVLYATESTLNTLPQYCVLRVTKWLQIAPNCFKRHQMAPNISNTLKIAPNAPKFLKITSKWSKPLKIAPKLLPIAPNRSKHLQIAPNCSKWVEMAPKGFKGLSMALNKSELLQIAAIVPNGSKWL